MCGMEAGLFVVYLVIPVSGSK